MQTSQSIDPILGDAVGRGDARGVVATAGNAKGATYTGAAGVRNAAGDAMTADSVFWIASMTKAITGACALQLVDQGRLALHSGRCRAAVHTLGRVALSLRGGR